MVMNRRYFYALLMTGAFLFPSCTGDNGADRKPVFHQVPELVEIKPENPVRIKLKRAVSGKYSWEISGDDTERIISTNVRLKESVEKDE